MSEYRRSYWKTVIAATAVGLAGVALVLGLVSLLWRRQGTGLGVVFLIAAGLLAAVALAALAAAVTAGGLIALRRDALEARGVPYASHRPRERLPGPALRAARRILRTAGRALGSRSRRLDLRPGDAVRVKNLPAILETLDAGGALDGLPFMPEMAAFCGRECRVFRRVEKIHDWVRNTGLRRMRDTVLLEGLRCDGASHGGCQSSCHLRWKDAWLERMGDGARTASAPRGEPASGAAPVDLERLLARSSTPVSASEPVRFFCQVTELAAGTTPLAWGDPRHYLRDLTRGNVRLGPLVIGVLIALFNRTQRVRGGVRFPCYGSRTPSETSPAPLGLTHGERVRVRTKREIEGTLDSRFRNRGLWFDAEMLRFCGGEYLVASRVDRVIQESTGRLVKLATPCVILEGVTASAEYRGFCAQNEAIFWRESWLERSASVEGE